MNKLKAFVMLDFITVRPYFTVKNLIIYGLLAVYLTSMTGNAASGMGVGVMLGAMFTGYPFALGDKSNMDALYATLSVDRKTVVMGRYVYALILNALAMLISIFLGFAAVYAIDAFREPSGSEDDIFFVVIVMFAIVSFVQSVQLPVYFRYGYAKAKILSLIPSVVIMAGYMAILGLKDMGGGLVAARFLTEFFESGLVIPVLIGMVFVVLFISYKLSLIFYKKREF